MTMGICPISGIYNSGTIPHGQRFLAGQIPKVRGYEIDFETIQCNLIVSDGPNIEEKQKWSQLFSNYFLALSK